MHTHHQAIRKNKHISDPRRGKKMHHICIKTQFSVYNCTWLIYVYRLELFMFQLTCCFDMCALPLSLYAGLPHIFPQSVSARECNPVSSSPGGSACPGCSDLHTLQERTNTQDWLLVTVQKTTTTTTTIQSVLPLQQNHGNT